MTADYYSAVLPETRTVLGMRLRPLSLGHLVLLKRIGSPFANGEIPTLESLATAVMICASTFREALDYFDDPKLSSVMFRWHERITGNDRWLVRLGLRRVKTVDFIAEAAAFFAYLQEHQTMPKYASSDSDFRPIGYAFEQMIKVRLMRDLHFSEAELFDRSWLLCLWDYAALLDMENAIHIVGEKESQHIKETFEHVDRIEQLVREGKIKFPNGHSS